MTRPGSIAKACVAFTATLWLTLDSGPALAAGLDCARASTPVEKLVCGAPALRARDTLMAKLYAAALSKVVDDRIRTDQRAWLAKLGLCGDATCATASYDGRLDELMRTEGGQAASSRFYTDGSNGSDGALTVFGPVAGYAAISIGATHVGKGGAEAGDVNADGASGVVALKAGAAEIRKDGCVLALRRRDEASWTVRQSGRCQLAAGVDFGGVYRR